MSFSNSLETDVLTYFFTTASAPTRPTAWYLGLHLSDPGETGSGAELSGDAYARQAINSMTVSGTNPTKAENAGAIEFPTATGDWGEVAYVSIWTADTSGTMLAYASLSSNKTVSTGDVLRIPAGDLDINME